ncbi:hypothetical protein SAMN05444161_8490 [Rhizobiales bacterium GAS191]|jgi:hypothetical protein|nr:hypothetical protein SAMN05444161_8490 [Rhizobiales bacterium GAS191]
MPIRVPTWGPVPALIHILWERCPLAHRKENERGVFAKAIEFTDFPLAEIRLYCAARTIMFVALHLKGVCLTFRAAGITQSPQERSVPRIRTTGPRDHAEFVCMRIDIGNQAAD